MNRWNFLLLRTEHRLTETGTRYAMHREITEVIKDVEAVAHFDDGTGDYGISGDALTKLTSNLQLRAMIC